ncbi:hypothetical protein TVAG_428720 [Trichomonas vaginalis G3]|uniref:Uncharacterized protein n=1 Tax=Trichomonas vaginalis (strain ATCC PRA-98 / G3) TaxID=412133 RepID=A2FJ62_TRIV3|nr:hypothetical protein TVAGG3_0914600 [Trichomonas vaginalis G3]EAX95069.1 hypothetical protein TVAG_428720 [Trichomonas vaginalis G3]KAI5484689.1 hypothetical protein TVAGG3_0914600 [Trichomonas vaginalis G3]|eukprot:XP_001307999.1 hypothetical protein [Trichomonas vaginalis G3]
MENSFDHQASVFLDTVNRNRSTAPLRSTNIEDPSLTTVFDPIFNRINSIEERLNASDSIFRLAAQSNTIKDKERREQIRNVSQYANKLNQRIDAIENQLNSIQDMVTKTVVEEYSKNDKTSTIKALIEESKSKFTDRFSKLETLISESNKKNTKAIKKLKTQLQIIQNTPQDETQVEEIRSQIAEMKRYQDNVMSLMRTAMQQSEHDYGQVASELNGVWSQISTKRD